MMAPVTLFLALAAGFSHAFEADHLVAVSNIVTRRTSPLAAIKDGIFWGLGHTSTILLVASVYLLGKFVLDEADFKYLEACVGAMLIVLGSYRLYKLYENQSHGHVHPEPAFSLAYGVGMMHGLAGSGALLISVLTQVEGSLNGLGYLLIFGAGSVFGMMLAAGIFSMPFSVAKLQNTAFRTTLTLVSSLLCVGLGFKVLVDNLAG
jgi:hypothetical protein